MFKTKVYTLSLIIGFMASGCTPEEQQLALGTLGTLAGGGAMGNTGGGNTYPAQQNDQYYKLGANDGCATKQTNTVKRNVNYYQTNQSYKSGWDYGYSQCRLNTSTVSNTPNTTTSEVYKLGANDGCLSKQNNQLKRDNYKYSYDASYKQGWDYGYSNCKVNTQPTTTGNSLTLGQQDGCYSGQYNQLKRDNYKYSYDASYKQGWDQGYQSCRVR